MLDRQLVEDVAFRLSTDAVLVEKDWYVVRALGLLSAFDHGDVTPTFSGGTSLSKGWGLIKRFSEDIDFKLTMPTSGIGSKDRTRRKAYRSRVLAALATAEFELVGPVTKLNADNFFAANFGYPSLFTTGQGLRPHLRVEMTFQRPALLPVVRPIRSLIGEAQSREPEVASFLCVDPIETAADKLSALAWRVCTLERGGERDDPTIIRHLHDLAALSERIAAAENFPILVRQTAVADTARGGDKAPADVIDRTASMLDRLRREQFWSDEYGEYVRQVSFAAPGETISFATALASLESITARLSSGIA